MSDADRREEIAARLLGRLLESGDIELVSSDGVALLTPLLADRLRRWRHEPDWAASVSAWLLDHDEVDDLYIDDSGLEAAVVATIDELRLVEAAPSGPPQRPNAVARRDDLESLLRAEPDNLDHQLVYGDWLLEHDDPYGELIARRVSATLNPDRPELAQAAATWQREHGERLFGRLAEYLDVCVHLDWAGGFVRAATLGKHRDDPGPYQGAILLRWLLEHRAAMLLGEIEILPFENHWTRDQHHELLAVVLERPRPLLRRLSALHSAGGGGGGSLDGLAERLPNLEHLHLQLRSASVSDLVHPNLRTLIWDVVISREQAAAFAKLSLPRLESLGFGLEQPLATLGSALARAELPALNALQIRSSSELLAELLAAPWCRQIERLDLSDGSLVDADAHALAARPWPALRHLDVSGNQLGPDGVAAVERMCPELIVIDQRRADDEEWEEGEDEDDEGDEDGYYADIRE